MSTTADKHGWLFGTDKLLAKGMPQLCNTAEGSPDFRQITESDLKHGYVGCFNFQVRLNDFMHAPQNNPTRKAAYKDKAGNWQTTYYSPETCVQQCTAEGYRYAGMVPHVDDITGHLWPDCYCSQEVGTFSHKMQDAICRTDCGHDAFFKVYYFHVLTSNWKLGVLGISHLAKKNPKDGTIGHAGPAVSNCIYRHLTVPLPLKGTHPPVIWSKISVADKPWMSIGGFRDGPVYSERWSRPDRKGLLMTVWKTPLPFDTREPEGKNVTLRCDWKAMALRCSAGGSIQVTSAFYGRAEAGKFDFGCGGYSACRAKVDVSAEITKQCAGRADCHISVSPQSLKVKEQPCPGAVCYLKVTWLCAKRVANAKIVLREAQSQPATKSLLGEQQQVHTAGTTVTTALLPPWPVLNPHFCSSKDKEYRCPICPPGERLQPSPVAGGEIVYCTPPVTDKGISPCLHKVTGESTARGKALNIADRAAVLGDPHAQVWLRVGKTLVRRKSEFRSLTQHEHRCFDWAPQRSWKACALGDAGLEAPEYSADMRKAEQRKLDLTKSTKEMRHMKGGSHICSVKSKVQGGCVLGIEFGDEDAMEFVQEDQAPTANKLINICGMQLLIDCTPLSSTGGCNNLFDRQEASRVGVQKGTSVAVYFTELYVFLELQIFYPPDAFTETKADNLFSAAVQCKLSDGTWHKVGSVRGVDKTPGYQAVSLNSCPQPASSWRVAKIVPVSQNSPGVVISEFRFFGGKLTKFSDVTTVGPSVKDPCSMKMQVDPSTSPRQTITTTYQTPGCKKKIDPSSFDVSCKAAAFNEVHGEPVCNKVADLAGNSAVLFQAHSAASVQFEFAGKQQFSRIYLFKHPSVHKRLQLSQFAVVCTLDSGKHVEVASFPRLQKMDAWAKMKGGWVELPFRQPCPEASSNWYIRKMSDAAAPSDPDQPGTQRLLVFDLHLSDKASKQLPALTDTKINGFCVTHQSIPLGDTWRLGGMGMNHWQELVEYKPKLQIYPGSSLLVQLLFEHVRIDWPSSTDCRGFKSAVYTNLGTCNLNILPAASTTTCTAMSSGGTALLLHPPMALEDATWKMRSKMSKAEVKAEFCPDSEAVDAQKDPKWKQKAMWKATCSSAKMTSHLTEGYATKILQMKLTDYLRPGNKSIVMSSYQHTRNKARKLHWRCGVKGELTISYWYRPPTRDMPCIVEDW